MLQLGGQHNFFLHYIKNEAFYPNAKYLIPNCSLGLTGDLQKSMTVRENGKIQKVSPTNRGSVLKSYLGQDHMIKTSKDGEQTIISLIDKFVRQ